MRYFAELSYRGTDFHGWQVQHNAHTVQQSFNEALAKILRMPTVESVGSGRTDTGVHALQQYAHIDIIGDELPVSPSEIAHRLSSMLQGSLALHRLVPVDPTAHVRYDATSRRYHYLIARQQMPHAQGLSALFTNHLKIDVMKMACAVLCEHEDFECFSRVKTSVTSFKCSIHHASWRENGPYLIFEIQANRFLRGMVRAIVGTMLEVGSGKLTLRDFKSILESKDRRKAGTAAPPQGLYLSAVNFPETVVSPPSLDPVSRMPGLLLV